MATLVLTTVGTLIGGPIGGAIGSILGASIDQRLLGTSARGPRLGDLSVQTSAYGTAIPKLFGTLRVAGTVIWATDLEERKHKSGGGKGKPKQTTYSYSASFAVALSGRRVDHVGRIWADGNLLRGADGDWKTDVGAFRLHPGDEAQGADPLIASAEGIAATPAHRGTAYAVFEDLQLADYGNRIPSLTFEVVADPGGATIGAIAAELGGGAIAGGDATLLGGFAAAGDSVRGAFETLAEVVPLSLRDDGAALTLVRPAGVGTPIPDAMLGAHAGDKPVPRRDRQRQAAGALPDEVALTYYDPSRDYQTGTQRARRGGVARRRTEIGFPAALDAGLAKALAEARLAADWAGRATATLALPWAWLDVRAGDVVALADGGRWRVAAAALEAMVVKLELAALPGTASAPAAASAGRATRETDAPAGATILHLLDLPPIEATPPDVPRLWIAAAGTTAGWRRAALSASLDGGARWDDIGGTATAAVIGAGATVLAPADPSLLDRRNAFEVVLAHDGMVLAARDDISADATANAALVGDEIVQFADAVQIAPARWRLSRLLRGRRGTEWAIATHVSGERFVLLDGDALLAYDPPASAIGATLMLMAAGIGDAAPATASLAVRGRAVRPPAPVRLHAAVQADGAVLLGWTRRSRAGWIWIDGADAPLAEESERYRLVLAPSAGVSRTIVTTAPAFAYTAAMRAADGAAVAATITATLVQLGSLAESLPAATATFSL